ncbi:MAG TPA: 16S rRNA (adenine(1518)-N(6)/adenine(1519)-N(6))-dimethyltransferase RsmA [Saprospiraceae bacterium]|nr:16S rRNA (adenine(1518)-N(6)/adenine(1519)-N(6))-dimethyltransferase RsmA [Saprospiraceae bacterium]HQW55227.1 16S rRNA (adenine(1518)-N(6)/adenine(1519)-N(6))-dimethyltransferase RsmA [Saprospiraceae bacterium]
MHRIKAKKSFGQHFLRQPEVAENIVAYVGDIDPGMGVLEVGPGMGIMTQYLSRKYSNYKCCELEDDMISYLQKHFPELQGKIIQSDILRLPFDKVFDGEQFILIGNFPYNISSQIVFHMLKYHEYVPRMIGMFQKEMAERIIASPGNKDFGVISILTQAYYQGKKLMELGPNDFDPPPRVKSMVIELEKRADGGIDVDYKEFRKVVKTSFLMRRKMLRNNLKSIVENKDLIADKFFDHRPEELSVNQFVFLTKYLNNPEQYNLNNI